jgi:hypothetical protein
MRNQIAAWLWATGETFFVMSWFDSDVRTPEADMQHEVRLLRARAKRMGYKQRTRTYACDGTIVMMIQWYRNSPGDLKGMLSLPPFQDCEDAA